MFKLGSYLRGQARISGIRCRRYDQIEEEGDEEDLVLVLANSSVGRRRRRDGGSGHFVPCLLAFEPRPPNFELHSSFCWLQQRGIASLSWQLLGDHVLREWDHDHLSESITSGAVPFAHPGISVNYIYLFSKLTFGDHKCALCFKIAWSIMHVSSSCACVRRFQGRNEDLCVLNSVNDSK